MRRVPGWDETEVEGVAVAVAEVEGGGEVGRGGVTARMSCCRVGDSVC